MMRKQNCIDRKSYHYPTSSASTVSQELTTSQRQVALNFLTPASQQDYCEDRVEITFAKIKLRYHWCYKMQL